MRKATEQSKNKESFNPCSNGLMVSIWDDGRGVDSGRACFNPCSNGLMVSIVNTEDFAEYISEFQSLF